MQKPIAISADELVSRLTSLASERRVCVLDSCGAGHLGSHLLIAGIDPVGSISLNGPPEESLNVLQEHLVRGLAAIFTISYEFGLKLQNGRTRHVPTNEPDIYVALFDSLIVHDYASGRTFETGRGREIDIPNQPVATQVENYRAISGKSGEGDSNFSRDEYFDAVETIKEYIRSGDTYQSNLTQTLSVPISVGDSPGSIFRRLRNEHPAPFAAYIERGDSQVVSVSPERFFRIDGRTISTSPIKGTRRRGRDENEDGRLRRELISSVKDRAENTMIVDLLRNDLGRVCDYGTVSVEKLCDLEEHPTLFHLVSTVEGRLRRDASFRDVLQALFPCGSITGAPKIRTIQIIDQLERGPRGLSMGAIGYSIPENEFEGLAPGVDLSVAIRTMVIRDGVATFNVGGGITIESEPAAEYDESLLKAKALLSALGNK